MNLWVETFTKGYGEVRGVWRSLSAVLLLKAVAPTGVDLIHLNAEAGEGWLRVLAVQRTSHS